MEACDGPYAVLSIVMQWTRALQLQLLANPVLIPGIGAERVADSAGKARLVNCLECCVGG